MRELLVVQSDKHAGHKLGLMNPNTVLFDEDPVTGEAVPWIPNPTASQRYLWKLEEAIRGQVEKLAQGDVWHYLDNGDQTQGNHFKEELVSTRSSDQVLIAFANVKPWMEMQPASVRLTTGTGVHEFGEGSTTFLAAKQLNAEYPTSDIKAVNHGLKMYNGVNTDYSHHGPPPGSRSWLRGNEARYYLRDRMMQEIIAGRVPPRLYIRSHYHDFVEETLTVGKYKSTLVITPSMCLIGFHGRKVMRSAYQIPNGAVVFELVDGELVKVISLMNVVDIRTREA